jgi:hypothetical protein
MPGMSGLSGLDMDHFHLWCCQTYCCCFNPYPNERINHWPVGSLDWFVNYFCCPPCLLAISPCCILCYIGSCLHPIERQSHIPTWIGCCRVFCLPVSAIGDSLGCFSERQVLLCSFPPKIFAGTCCLIGLWTMLAIFFGYLPEPVPEPPRIYPRFHSGTIPVSQE